MLQSDYTKAEEMKYICNSVKLQIKSFSHPTWYWPNKWMLKGKEVYFWTLVKKYQVFSTYTRGFVFLIIKNWPQRKKKFTKKATPNIFFFPSTDHKFFNEGVFQRKPVFCTEEKRKVSNSPVVPCPLPHPSVTRLVSGTSLGNQTSCIWGTLWSFISDSISSLWRFTSKTILSLRRDLLTSTG